MVGERPREYLDGGLRSKVQERRPAGDLLSVRVETPHETNLRIALHAAGVDAIVIGSGAVSVKAEMDLIRGARGLPVDDRCHGPEQKGPDPHRLLPVRRSRPDALPSTCDRFS
jgi:hypothetical protein